MVITNPYSTSNPNNTNDAFRLSWNSAARATSYEVYIKWNNEGWGLNGSTTQTQKSWGPQGTYGTRTYRVKACNSDGCSGYSAETSITNSAPPRAPVLSAISSKSVTAGQLLTVPLSATDADSSNLNFTFNGSPPHAGMSIVNQSNSKSAQFRWTPPASITGNFNVGVKATDQSGLSDSTSFTVTVLPPANIPPVLDSIPSFSKNQGDSFSYRVGASDADNGPSPLAFSLSGQPSGMAIHASTGTITWNYVLQGSYQISVSVYDGKDTASRSFSLNVGPPPNSAPYTPSLTLSASSINQGSSVVLTASGSDPDGDALSYRFCQNLSNGSSAPCNRICGTSSSCSWTPPSANTYYFWVQASDSQYTVSSTKKALQVIAPNQKPNAVMTNTSPVTIEVGQSVNLTASASDPDGEVQSVTFLVTGSSNLNLSDSRVCNGSSASHFSASWTPQNPGTYYVRAQPRDCENAVGDASGSITVQVNAIAPPQAPQLSSINVDTGRGNYTLVIHEVAAADSYQMYENGVAFGSRVANNSSREVSFTDRSSGQYRYCARAYRGALESPLGSGGLCVDIHVSRTLPDTPEFSAMPLTQSGPFTLAWENVGLGAGGEYRLEYKTGGIDSASSWQEVQRSNQLSYQQGPLPVGLHSYKITACESANACSPGQQLVINMLPPYVAEAQYNACGTGCLKLSGIGFDPGASVTLASMGDNSPVTATLSYIDATTAHLALDEQGQAAMDSFGLVARLTNRNQATSSIVAASYAAARRAVSGSGVLATHIEAQGEIFVTEGSRLIGLDAATGQYLPGWPVRLDGRATATPAFDSFNQSIIVGTQNHSLYSFDFLAKQQWKTPLHGAIEASAVLDEHPLIYLGAMDGSFYAVDTMGEIQWQYLLSAGVNKAAKLFADGRVFVNSVDGVTHIINRGNLGPYALRWQVPLQNGSYDCNLALCDIINSGWQPGEDEISDDRMYLAGRLFYALLNRSPSQSELNFWAYALLYGAEPEEVVEAFLQAPEAAGYFSAGQSAEQFLQALYRRMFGANPPELVSGKGFSQWLAELQSGMSRTQLILALSNSEVYLSLTTRALDQAFYLFYNYCNQSMTCQYSGDSDGDGLSDSQELELGLNPLDPHDGRLGHPSNLRWQTIEAENGIFTMAFNPVPSATYYELRQAVWENGQYGAFAVQEERAEGNQLTIVRTPGSYQYKLVACLTTSKQLPYCSEEESAVLEVNTLPVVFTLMTPVPNEYHTPGEPLAVRLCLDNLTGISEVRVSLDEQSWFDTELAGGGCYETNIATQSLANGSHTLFMQASRAGQLLSDSAEFFIGTKVDGVDPELPPVAQPYALPASADNQSARVGLLPGEFRVDESGAATYQVPISLPQGIAGVTPSLSLNYSTLSGNGTMGVGWSLGGLSAISRCRQTLEQDGAFAGLTLSNDDRFCLDGQKLIAVNGSYGENGTEYRTEIDSKTRIISYTTSGNGPDYFTVESEDGSTRYYGNTDIAGARTDATLSVDGVQVVWYLGSISDNYEAVDNSIFYRYQLVQSAAGVEHYLDEIQYSDNRVSFVYQTGRTDIPAAFVQGIKLLSERRLERIEVYNHNQVKLRAYKLGYQNPLPADNGQVERLQQITECGMDDICRNPTTFQWHGQQVSGSKSFFEGGLGNLDIFSPTPVDANGDGLTDLFYLRDMGNNAYSAQLKLNTGSGLGSQTYEFSLYNDDVQTKPVKLLPADIDGDGGVELLYYTKVGGSFIWRYYDVADNSSKDLGFSLSQTGTSLLLHDVNTDGYPDLLYRRSSQMWLALNLPGGGFDTPQTVSGGFTQGPSQAEQLAAIESGMFGPQQLSLYQQGDSTRPLEHGDAICFDEQAPIDDETSYVNALADNLPAADFNGDGTADLMIKMRESLTPTPGDCELNRYYWAVYSLDETLGNYTYTRITELFGTDNLNKEDFRVGDINGDGLTDVVALLGGADGKLGIYTSNGKGFRSQQKQLDISRDSIHSLTLFDLNHDGRADIMFYDSHRNVWRVYYQSADQQYLRLDYWLHEGSFDKFKDAVMLVDWDGDGYPGTAKIRMVEDRRLYAKTDDQPSTKPANYIYAIENGFGVKTEIEYAPLTDNRIYSKGSQAQQLQFGRCQFKGGSCIPVVDIISAQYVVSRVSSDSPGFSGESYLDNSVQSVEYYYQGLRAQAGGRGMLGFEKISTFDPQAQVSTETLYRQDFPYAGMPVATLKYLGQYDIQSPGLSHSVNADGQFNAPVTHIARTQWLSYAQNTYATIMLQAGEVYSPYLFSSSEQQFAANQDITATVAISETLTTNTYIKQDDNHLNLHKVDVVTRDASGVEVSKVSTTNTYGKDDISKWWLGRVADVDVVHSRPGVSPVTRKSSFTYDGQTGLLETETIKAVDEEVDDKFEILITRHCYDSVGNKTKLLTHSSNISTSCTATSYPDTVDDPAKILRVKRWAFDSQHRYVDQQSNARFLLSEVDFRDAFGNPTQMTDINGVVTRYQYDAFGQLQATSVSSGGGSRVVRGWQGSLGAPYIAQLTYHFVERTEAMGAPTQYRYYDKLGREVAQAKQGFDGAWVVQTNKYDERGRLVAVSNPYYLYAGGDDSTTQYDRLGRPYYQHAASGVTTYISYQGLTTQTDTQSNDSANVQRTRSETANALGETVSVSDEVGELTYSYDATGNLVKVQSVWLGENPGSTVTTQFDQLGRKVAMDDPDKGVWTYRYNALGELIEQKDANGHTTTFYRDNLGRTVKRQVSGNSVNEVTDYAWGSDHRLDSEGFSHSTAGRKQYGYDNYGRITRLTHTLDNGEQYTSQTTYDQYGRVFQQFDPQAGLDGCFDSERSIVGQCWGIRYHYNAQGYAYLQEEARFSAAADESLRKAYMTVQAMDAFGQVTQSVQGNQVVTDRVYNENSGLLESIQASSLGRTFQSNRYSFDNKGNLRERHRDSLAESFAKRDEHFGYDAVERLTHINNVEMVSYQANGNIDSKADVQNGAAYQYGQQASQCTYQAGPHAVTQVGNLSYCYDRNGNQTRTYENGSAVRRIDYGHFDKPTLISAGSATTEFAYDSKRSRYKRVTVQGAETTTTYYLGNVEVVSKTGSNVVEIKRYLPGAIDTRYQQDGVDTGTAQLRYLHKDHLGSIDSITDENGKLVDKLYFDAWGKRSSIAYEDWGLDAQAIAAESTYLGIGLLLTTRGFTGHEHVDHADVIHMNGRIYDPTLGRFLQADPHIQAPGNSQSYNRYSYVLNNPLSMTDPSGYFFSKLWKGIKKFAGLIVAAVVSYYCPACSKAVIGAIAGGVDAAVNGGNILQGAVLGAFTAGIQGSGWYSELGGSMYGQVAKFGINTALNNARQSLQANPQQSLDNDFKRPDIHNSSSYANRLAILNTIGGSASDVTGGKFGNGASFSAFLKSTNRKEMTSDRASKINMMNHLISEYKNNYRLRLFNQEYDELSVGGFSVEYINESFWGDNYNSKENKLVGVGQLFSGQVGSNINLPAGMSDALGNKGGLWFEDSWGVESHGIVTSLSTNDVLLLRKRWESFSHFYGRYGLNSTNPIPVYVTSFGGAGPIMRFMWGREPVAWGSIDDIE
ncbi:FG-GAP-like repeat-containing protein [Bowmanella denitrificans]|uniref:FG-GAP-like repeat-containing protein n=1 Tax=Bowmanella denitrificans TaxID=366582 RepID=UPI0031D1611E